MPLQSAEHCTIPWRNNMKHVYYNYIIRFITYVAIEPSPSQLTGHCDVPTSNRNYCCFGYYNSTILLISFYLSQYNYIGGLCLTIKLCNEVRARQLTVCCALPKAYLLYIIYILYYSVHSTVYSSIHECVFHNRP